MNGTQPPRSGVGSHLLKAVATEHMRVVSIHRDMHVAPDFYFRFLGFVVSTQRTQAATGFPNPRLGFVLDSTHGTSE